MDNTHLIALGAGIGVGLLALYAVIELFPLLMLGCAGYLVYTGLKHTLKESSLWQSNGQVQK